MNWIQKYRNAIAAFFFLLVAGMLVARTVTLLNVPGKPDPGYWGMRDFRDAIYYPVVSWTEGNNPYDASEHMERYPVGQLFPLYSPLTLVIHLPFGFLPYTWSEGVYFAANILCTLLLAVIAIHMVGLRVRLWMVFAFAGLILLSRPGHMCQVLGQTAFTATLFSWLAIHFANQKAHWRSGAFLTLASFKPTFGFVLFPLLFAKGHYRAALIGSCLMLVTTGAMALSILDRIPEGESVNNVLEHNRDEFQSHEGVNSFSTFSRDDLFPLINKSLNVELTEFSERTLTLLIVGISGLAIWFRNRKRKDHCSDGVTSALICLTVIVSIYHHSYDTIILFLPWLAIVVGKHPDWRNLSSKTRWTLVILLSIPAINYLSTNTFTSNMEFDDLTRKLVTSINGVALLLAWLCLLSLCVADPIRKRHAKETCQAAHDEAESLNTEIPVSATN